MNSDKTIEQIREEHRDLLLKLIENIDESEVGGQSKMAGLLAIIAEQAVETRFILEEIRDKL